MNNNSFNENDFIDINSTKIRLRNLYKKVRNYVVGICVGVVALIILFNSAYIIEDGESGVKLRLGLLVDVEYRAGIHFKIPFIENIRKVNVNQVRVMEYGYRTIKNATSSTEAIYEDVDSEATIIVDAVNNNASIALINLMIEYKVDNPANYLYKVEDVESTLRLVLEDVVRNAAQQLTLDEAKTKKEIIDRQVKQDLQDTMDLFQAGIKIVSVNTQNVNFFPNVEAAYRQKENANQYKNSKLEEAQKYSNIIIPQSTAEATKLVEEAMAYKTETIANAKAEVARFNALYDEYVINPQIIKDKYYVEALEALISNNEVIIEHSDSNVNKFYNINGSEVNSAVPNIITNGGEANE